MGHHLFRRTKYRRSSDRYDDGAQYENYGRYDDNAPARIPRIPGAVLIGGIV